MGIAMSGDRAARSLLLAGVIVLTACSGRAGGPAGPSAPAASAPRSAPAIPAATGVPSSGATAEAAPSASAGASGGPVVYDAWVERQGFGGSSGLHQVFNDTEYTEAHRGQVTAFDLEQGLRMVDHLAAWLAEHPPTACWADYHATATTAPGRLHDGYATAHDSVESGQSVPVDVATGLAQEAEAAYSLPAP